MSKRKLAIGGVLLAVILAIVAYLMMGGDEEEKKGDKGKKAEERRALLEKKRSAHESKKSQLAEPRLVVGMVTREEDGQGIPGAVVLLHRKAISQGVASSPGQPPRPIYAVTDEAGTFQLKNVPPGRYALSASAQGYLSASKDDVRFNIGKDEQRVSIALKEGGFPLKGIATDIGGGPVGDVLVQVNSMDQNNIFGVRYAPYSTITNENGEYQVNVPEGSYVITTWHPDYVATYRITQVRDGPRVENLELTPAGVIEGRVVARGSGKPVEGAMVAFQDGRNGNTGGFRMNISADGRVVTSDSEGFFRLDGIHPGVAMVDARAEGFATKETVAVPVGIGETVTGVEIEMDKAFKISGFVVPKGDPEGSVEGVLVGAYSLQPPSLTVSTAPSDADGYFEILGMLPGRYVVGALGEDVLPNISGASAVVEDQDVNDVLVEMDAGQRIRGTVDPPGPATVKLSVDMEEMSIGKVFDSIGAAFASATADAEGNFDIGPVKPGKYKVIADTPDGSHGELDIEVPDEDVEGVVVPLETRASLAGVVIDESGAIQAGVTVRVKLVDGNDMDFATMTRGPFGNGGVATGEDGTFQALGLEGGKYSITVRDKKGRPIPWADDGPTAAEPSAFLVEVNEGEEKVGVELRVQERSGVLSGVVVDADGIPVPDAWVTAGIQVSGEEFGRMMAGPKVPDENEPEKRKGVMPPDDDADDFELPGFFAEQPVLTDEAGAFTVTGLRSGRRYTITAEGEKGGARGRVQDLTPDQSGVRIQLEALAGLKGKVTLDGDPVASYTLEISGPTNRSKGVSDELGKYKLERVEPGEYTLSVRSETGAAVLEEVEVVAGKMTDLDIELEGFGKITGTLVDNATGDPIKGMAVLVQPEKGQGDASQFMAMMTGFGGTKTKRDGTFVAKGVPPGKGTIIFLDTKAAMGAGGGLVAAEDYDLESGEDLDLGEINGVDSSSVDKDDQGKLGLRVTSATFAKRPRPPGTDLEEEEEDERDEDETEHLWVRTVDVDWPADEAGLEPGDQILAIDGRPVTELGLGAADLLLEGPQIKVGQEVSVDYERDGSRKTVRMKARGEDEDEEDEDGEEPAEAPDE